MPSCIRLSTTKLDWLIGKTSVRTELRSKKDVWKGNIYSIFKNEMYGVMNVLWKAVFQIEI